jgi:hypothetical protein
MRSFTQRFLLTGSLLLLTILFTNAQFQIEKAPVKRCQTMEELNKLIRDNPGIQEQWKAEGERQYKAYLLRQQQAGGNRVEDVQIIIPIVFHLVDIASTLAGITDRDIYEQVEALNKDYAGLKADEYKNVIPPEITSRVGKIPIKFVLARRDPTGNLTSGIERRANVSPNHVSIKSFATGGLDAWDSSKYVNVWCGTFSGSEAGLLGIATFPFTTGNGPQGVVVATLSMPYTSNVSRSYYPQYADGSTLAHEIGHYFYLWHTFGDNAVCNNSDFRIQPGWPLAAGAGPEGDDTPDQKGNPQTDGFVYGNPSQNYNVGCINVPYGIVYGSFMNYFDDRALFMFTDGMRKRVISCINSYRPGLLTTNGATPPVPVTDAFMVDVNLRGTLPERVTFTSNTPLTARVRNSGTGNLTSVTINLGIDGGTTTPTVFPLSLVPGADTTLSLGNVVAASGGHTLTVYTSNPNGTTDNFTNNDTLQSFTIVQGGTITAPFTESFTGTTFPPANWFLYNPNGGATNTWVRDATSGFTAAGAAAFNNRTVAQVGTLDELISPAFTVTAMDSTSLNFKVANAAFDSVNVSVWDGLEVYVSGNGGLTFTRAYKKTGTALSTVPGPVTTIFSATPLQPERWRSESINLLPYIIPGQKMMFKFRNTNANGNNTFVDDISVVSTNLPKSDAAAVSLINIPPILCGGSSITPTLVFANKGKDSIVSLKINYQLDNGAVTTISWTGLLLKSQSAQQVLNTISNISIGLHTLVVYTSLPNGFVDPNPSNDTLKISLVVLSPVQPPVKEGFEGTTFPPANWVLLPSGNPYTWQRTTWASYQGSASALIRNYASTAIGSKDDLYAPLVQLSAPDSVFLMFNVAHVTSRYPGSTAIPLDTLEVLLTKDCGISFTSVYKKWGADLQTVGDPNFPAVFPTSDTIGFVPAKNQWRRDSVDLSPYLAGSNGMFQVVFRNTNNNGNNTYLDNVNITSLILPAKLKSQGFLIAPNPTIGNVTIRHYLRPTNLKGVQVINPAGQVVILLQYNGNAQSAIPIDLTRYPNGIYSIRMVYTDKVIVQRVVKIR